MTAIEKKSLKVGRYVDTAHVDTVIREYKQTRWVENSEKIGKEDSRSIWYSIEELEEFFLRCKSHGADGVRIYFGVYPSDYDSINAGMQTTVFVATKNKEYEYGPDNKDLYISTENGTQILAYNNGGICPIICPGGKRSGTGDADDWGEIGVTLIDRGDKGLSVI